MMVGRGRVRMLVAIVAVLAIVPMSARAATMTLTDCYELRHTMSAPVAALSTHVPNGYAPRPVDPAGLIGTYEVRSFSCARAGQDVRAVLLMIPAVRTGVVGSHAALVSGFTDDASLDALFAGGCLSNRVRAANLTFGVVGTPVGARTGVMLADAPDATGVGSANEVAVPEGNQQAQGLVLVAAEGGSVRSVTMSRGEAASVAGTGTTLFQSGAGPLGQPVEPALARHLDGGSLTLTPSC